MFVSEGGVSVTLLGGPATHCLNAEALQHPGTNAWMKLFTFAVLFVKVKNACPAPLVTAAPLLGIGNPPLVTKNWTRTPGQGVMKKGD